DLHRNGGLIYRRCGTKRIPVDPLEGLLEALVLGIRVVGSIPNLSLCAGAQGKTGQTSEKNHFHRHLLTLSVCAVAKAKQVCTACPTDAAQPRPTEQKGVKHFIREAFNRG